MSNPGQPDPELRRLLDELVSSQKMTNRWMLVLTGLLLLLTLALVVIALFFISPLGWFD